MNSPKRMLQDGGHLLRQQPRTQEYHDSEEENSEDENSENEKRYRNLPDQELTEEKIDEIYGDLKAKKRRILDTVLKTIPDHLQTRAKRFCDALKCKDHLFILPMVVSTLTEKHFVDPTYDVCSCKKCKIHQNLEVSNTICLKTRTKNSDIC